VAKKKLKKFAELNTFSHVFQPTSPTREGHFFLRGRWKEDYFHNKAPLILEIGCGRGEYTVALGRKHPEQNFIGIDIKGDRMWTGAKAALEEGLHNVAFLRIQAQHINAFFGPDEVQGIWLTFPDPQARESRKNKRLSSPEFLKCYKQMLSPDSPIHLKTDNARLYHYTLQVIQEGKHNLHFATDDLYRESTVEEDIVKVVQTRYEKMFLDRDMPIHYVKWSLQKNY
jgi:tRNA (guanine-N7-)-methyltransferase